MVSTERRSPRDRLPAPPTEPQSRARAPGPERVPAGYREPAGTSGRRRSAALGGTRGGGGAAAQARPRAFGPGYLGNGGRGRPDVSGGAQPALRHWAHSSKRASPAVEVAKGPSLSLAGRGEPLRTAGLSLGRDRPRCALLSVSIPRARCGGSRGAGARPGPASRGRRGSCRRPGARGSTAPCRSSSAFSPRARPRDAAAS